MKPGPQVAGRRPRAGAAVWIVLSTAACSLDDASPERRDAYRTALETAATAPEEAWKLCGQLRDQGLRADCRLAVVESWALREETGTDELLELCATLEPAVMADECAFQVGERRRAPEACARAGAFADDCRLHLLSIGLARWVPKRADPTDTALLARLAQEAMTVGLDPADPRAWSSWFRWTLGQQEPLDRRCCRSLEPSMAEACWQTGRALYDDRLNQARDRGLYPCDGAELPALLRHAPDPDLEARRAEREASDLCPGRGE